MNDLTISKTFSDNDKFELVDLTGKQIDELYEILYTHEVRGGKDWKSDEKYTDLFEKEIAESNYISFPWLNKTFRVVSEESYWKLITDRNRGVYSEESLSGMSKLKIGIYGLSVGSNISLLCGKMGIGREQFISDMDDLETTNLNRILCGLTNIGSSKVDFVERRLLDFNPYLKIHKFTEGVQQSNIDAALNHGDLDFIVEEIDSFPMKIAVRKYARKHKIPVVMIVDNGEGVVLIVERYDLGYSQIWQQDDEYWNERLQNFLGPQDFADIVINHNVGGVEKVDPSMLQAIPRVINGELVSWPQVGAAAVLGGIVAGYAIKEIMGGGLNKKYYRVHVNLRDIIK